MKNGNEADLKRISNDSAERIPIQIARILRVWRVLETLQNAFRNADTAEPLFISMPAVRSAK